MGVDRNDYLIYGWKLPYEIKNDKDDVLDLWDDKYSPHMDGSEENELRIVSDGMSGKWTVVGIVLASSDEYSGFEFRISLI